MEWVNTNCILLCKVNKRAIYLSMLCDSANWGATCRASWDNFTKHSFCLVLNNRSKLSLSWSPQFCS